MRSLPPASILLAPALVVLGFVLATAGTVSAAEKGWGPIEILGEEIAPGSRASLRFGREASFTMEVVDVNVIVLRGARPGPTLCLVAAVHGDEINGVEIARRAADEADPATLRGTLIAVPVVNVWGFRSGNRYLADRRDLNRAFPGRADGSLASRIANAVFDYVLKRCDVLLDLHTGSGDRANLPQTRVQAGQSRALELARYFGVGIVLVGDGPKGSLRRAAGDAGIATVLYEAGGPLRFERQEIDRGVQGVHNVMAKLGITGGKPPEPDPQRFFQSSTWVRAPLGGIFLTESELGTEVAKGDVLGHVTDPVTSVRAEVQSPVSGTLIGMAYSQVVLPGYGLFHVARHEGEQSDFSETE